MTLLSGVTIGQARAGHLMKLLSGVTIGQAHAGHLMTLLSGVVTIGQARAGHLMKLLCGVVTIGQVHSDPAAAQPVCPSSPCLQLPLCPFTLLFSPLLSAPSGDLLPQGQSHHGISTDSFPRRQVVRPCE